MEVVIGQVGDEQRRCARCEQWATSSSAYCAECAGLIEPSWNVWAAVVAELEYAVPEAVFMIWFMGLDEPIIDETRIFVTAPETHLRWLADRFGRVLRTAAAAVLGPEAVLTLVARPTEGGSA